MFEHTQHTVLMLSFSRDYVSVSNGRSSANVSKQFFIMPQWAMLFLSFGMTPHMTHADQNIFGAGNGLPTEGQVRTALERMLSHPAFGASERRRVFLRYIVDEALAGRAHELKGYTVAISVFGRDESFDSKTDPVVRLEARRLRQDLDTFYVGPGAEDPIRISIPKGGYIPTFSVGPEDRSAPWPNAQPSEPAQPEPAPALIGLAESAPLPAARSVTTRLRLLAAVAAAALVLVAVFLIRSGPAPTDPLAARGYPRVAITALDAIDGSEESRVLSAGLAMELVHDLRRFEGLRIYQPLDGTGHDTLADRMRGEPGAIYAVGGTILSNGERVRIDANLRDLRSYEIIWSESYDAALEPEALADLRDTVAGLIATAIGQPYGPISDDLVHRTANVGDASIESYLCVLRAYEHRRAFSQSTYAPTRACLENAVARDPDYSDAWAMLGWLHLDAGRYTYPDAAGLDTEYALAYEAARQALSLAPDSVLALKALSSIEHYRARFAEGERLARRAVALNPYDPDALAQLGWRLAVRGKFDEGVPLLREAVERSVDPPGWYFHLLAIDHMITGDYAAMRREADRAALTSRPISNLLLAIAAGGTGDRETARAALSRIPANWDAEAYFRLHGATNEIVVAMMEGLETARKLAGVVQQP